MAEFETEARPLPAFLRNGNGGRGFLKNIERHIRGLETWQIVALAAAGVLAVDHAIAPKGMSFATKALDKLGMSKHPLPPPPPIPLPAAVAKGMFAGANAQAGWNRGMSPYGGWARNAPAGPWHYAHAAPGSQWEEFMNAGYNNGGYPWE
jgi:hypothetical protein